MSSRPSPTFPRPRTFLGVPGRGTVVLTRSNTHSSERGHYGLDITCTARTITGIICEPIQDENIQAPEATVKSGGINHSFVKIYLKPPMKNKGWAYDLAISAELDHKSQQVRTV